MLYYVLIDNSEGIDESEGLDVVGTTELNSKWCKHVISLIIVQKTLDMKKMSLMDVIIV